MKHAVWILILTLLGASIVLSQGGPPPSDIYLANLKIQRGTITLTDPVNVTKRPGYDNQPRFLPDDRSFFYSSLRDGQADIYRYDAASGKSIQVTQTAESEFAPSPMPDRRFFSVVRVEGDGVQRLWKFPQLLGPPAVIVENVSPIGAHAWVDLANVAVIMVDDPIKLLHANLIRGEAVVIAKDVGRPVQNAPGGISFTRRVDGNWNIEEWNPKTGKIRVITTFTGPEAEHAWLPDGSLLAPRDSAILHWRPGAKEWTEVANFAARGLSGIARLAVNSRGDRIAIVGPDSE